MRTLASSEYPDEMLHIAAFYQGIQCLLKQNQSSEKEIHFFYKIVTCDPSIYTMEHPKLIASNQKEASIRASRKSIILLCFR